MADCAVFKRHGDKDEVLRSALPGAEIEVPAFICKHILSSHDVAAYSAVVAATLILHRRVRMEELFDLTDAGL